MDFHFPLNRSSRLLALTLFLVTPLASVQAQPQIPSHAVDYGQSESHLASEIHDINRTQVKMGNEAAGKGRTRAVRDFGKQIAREYKDADHHLMEVAKTMHLRVARALATSEAELKNDQLNRLLMRKLSRSTGFNFDQAFLSGMKQGQQRIIALMQSAEAKLEPSVLKDYIRERLLPKAVKNYQAAVHLENRMMAKAEKTPPAG